MDAIFGIAQGASTWILALGLGALVLGIVLLTSGRRRRAKQEHGRERGWLAIALVVLGAVLAVTGAVAWATSFSTGA
jgi:hypothetical protein